jgi:hypothetical protein
VDGIEAESFLVLRSLGNDGFEPPIDEPGNFDERPDWVTNTRSTEAGKVR